MSQQSTRHLPGPWYAIPTKHRWYIGNDQGNACIINIQPAVDEAREAEIQDQRFANAALIAAAPDLLAALQEIEQELAKLQPTALTGSILQWRLPSLVLLARNAIARATGQEVK